MRNICNSTVLYIKHTVKRHFVLKIWNISGRIITWTTKIVGFELFPQRRGRISMGRNERKETLVEEVSYVTTEESGKQMACP